MARDMSVPGWTWWALEPTAIALTMKTALNPSAPTPPLQSGSVQWPREAGLLTRAAQRQCPYLRVPATAS